MLAIYKREIQAYFLTPIGYLYMGLFLLLTGIYYTFGNLFSQSSQFTGFLGSILFIYLFAIPLLTMRLFSEEKRQKTDQLLLTSPVSISGIVCGKFLAALTVYCGTLLVTVAYAVVIAVYGDLQTWETVGSYIGFIFLGSCYIAVGIFVSAGTENQLSAALISFFALMLIWIIDPVAQMVPTDTQAGLISAVLLAAVLVFFLFLNTRNWVIAFGAALIGTLAIGGFYLFKRDVFFGFIQKFLGWFSLNRRYQPFSMGLFKFDSLLYYASFSGLFLFLTVRLIEKRRWN
ncbi:ABC transporter permease [Treponema sp. OttesenSCG-928-L16]|nr:ABC transporter permease [Treponema sp. OttesenSCG-928-L16]